mmetsp:Transcript_25933/g.73527  ORF Transcript_25933/g.73527 Transcript_25933/m.73527 type:complete len:419 (+) Transcript_25933:260-1516(+)
MKTKSLLGHASRKTGLRGSLALLGAIRGICAPRQEVVGLLLRERLLLVLLGGLKVGWHVLPALLVGELAVGGVDSRFREAEHVGSFEHECEAAVEEGGLGGVHLLRVRVALEGVTVRAVRGHARVEGGAAGDEAALLGVVLATDEAHVLGHGVAVEPRRAERVLHGHPARGKDDKVGHSNALDCRRAGEHGVDAGVGVVVGDRVHAVELAEVILEGNVVAVVRHDVEGRERLLHLEHGAAEFGVADPLLFLVLEGGNGALKVPRVGEAVGADGAKVGQFKVALERLEDVAAVGVLLHLHLEAHAALHDTDLVGDDAHLAEFGGDEERALLRDDEEVAVRVGHALLDHAGVGNVVVHGEAGLGPGVAGLANGDDALDKVEGALFLGGDVQRLPAHLVGVDLESALGLARGAAHAPDGGR